MKIQENFKPKVSVLVINHNNAKFIPQCINSIINFHPNEKIVLVDSDSHNKEYFNKLPKNVIIADIGNKNYMEGALWYCYEKSPEEDFFYLIQDSMSLMVILKLRQPLSDQRTRG